MCFEIILICSPPQFCVKQIIFLSYERETGYHKICYTKYLTPLKRENVIHQIEKIYRRSRVSYSESNISIT